MQTEIDMDALTLGLIVAAATSMIALGAVGIGSLS